MPERRPVITLTTDFGRGDPYVAAMKGVILGINPEAALVDLTHDVLPHDILDGAFRLRCGFPWFPSGSIHIAVVDPGVGSARRPLLLVSENHRFLAPDNGLLSLVADAEDVRTVYHVTSSHYFRNPVSQTFHGRDVFASAAAWLAKGIDPAQFGVPISDWKRLEAPRTRTDDSGTLQGVIWSVDRFGNLISGITRADLETARERCGGSLVVVAGAHRIDREVRSYHEIPEGHAGFLVNSSDLVEIAAPRRSAAQALGLKPGDALEIRPQTST